MSAFFSYEERLHLQSYLKEGLSFKEISRRLGKDPSTISNHIDSYKSKKLNNRSPYETFIFYHGEDVLQKLGCKPVAPGDILLKPSLLKK